MAKTKKVQKKAVTKKVAVKKVVKKAIPAKKAPAKKAVVKKAVVKKAVTKKVSPKPAAKKAVAVTKKTVAPKAVAKKVIVKPVLKAVVKPVAKTPVKPIAKPAAKTTVKPIAKAIIKTVAKPVEKVVEKAPARKPSRRPSKVPQYVPTVYVEEKKIVLTEPVKLEDSLGFNNNKQVRPQVVMQPDSNKKEDTRTKYSEEDLKEFEVLITDKLDRAKKELKYIKESLSRKNDESSDNSNSNLKLLEDGADTLEKENFSQLAARQMKFIQQLEFAFTRIKNGTYGICIETGKLIPKERLRAVPHTQHSIEAKLNRR